MENNGGVTTGCGVEEELGQLCADLLDAEDKRPEPWVCLSLYHLARDDHEKAIGEHFIVFLSCIVFCCRGFRVNGC